MALAMMFAVLFYAAVIIFVGGLAFKIMQYARTPSPLPIATTPAPLTQTGAWFRVLREVAVFESLFFSNLFLWICAALFHFALWLVLLRHVRYFQEPVWGIVVLAQPFGMYAGFAMVAGLVALLARRFMIDRVKYITGPSDILMLLLLIGIGVSGLGMKFMHHTDIVMVKAFFLGLMRLQVMPLPYDPPLIIHLALVVLLLIIFPFSKLLHAPGVFFSPTRNMPDNPREKRHIVPWAAELEKGASDNG
jgi:nitrate reductase gamma subunit